MLLPELEYEALQFAARDTLDAYQLLSRKKNKLVKKYSDVFALRRVSRVIISECHRAVKHQYSVTLDDDTEWKADPALEKDQFYLHILKRLRNAFVEVLQVRCTDCSNFLLFAKNHAASMPMFALQEILVGSHEVVSLPQDLLSFVYGTLGATALRMIREAELEPHLDEAYLPLVQHPLAKLHYFHLWCVQLSKASLDFLFNGCSLRGFLAMIDGQDVTWWAEEYIEKFLAADATAEIAEDVTVHVRITHALHDAVLKPRSCKFAEKTEKTAADLMPCGLYESSKLERYSFKNASRKETLNVYIGNAVRSRKCCHCAFYLYRFSRNKDFDE